MKNLKSIRAFIGAKDFEISKSFYRELGFSIAEIDPKMCLVHSENLAFYLQDYYVKSWVNNTMLFLEVEELEKIYSSFKEKDLPGKFKGVKMTEIHQNEWGDEFFLHDPAGNLLHVGFFH
jgi:hypothetical protein